MYIYVDRDGDINIHHVSVGPGWIKVVLSCLYCLCCARFREPENLYSALKGGQTGNIARTFSVVKIPLLGPVLACTFFVKKFKSPRSGCIGSKPGSFCPVTEDCFGHFDLTRVATGPRNFKLFTKNRAS